MKRMICLERVSKRYRLGQVSTGTLALDLEQWWASWRGKQDRFAAVDADQSPRTLWAISDVSLDVYEGEVLGIMGSNGAGKSTLLKMLAMVTTPTKGTIKSRGRIASLLEVGTGFHPELTGQENIYLNGAILGMSRQETKARFDEIVQFSGCERFIDTPIKRYSSGMVVRLGFAVAAHLRCEIMIVDEVLAVGDAEFQKKCLGKLKEVATDRGRTVLFVSHNLGALTSLCDRGIVLADGRLTFDGDVSEGARHYLSNQKYTTHMIKNERVPVLGQEIQLLAATIRKSGEICTTNICSSETVEIVIDFVVLAPGSSYALSIELANLATGPVFASSSLDARPNIDLGKFKSTGEYRAHCKLPTEMMPSGVYTADIACAIPAVKIIDKIPGTLSFEILDDSSPIAILGEGRRGVVVPRLEWTIEPVRE